MGNSILGVHLIPIHNRPGDYEYIRRLQPGSVKIVDPDVAQISRIHQAAPDTLIVLRNHPRSEQHDDVRRDAVATGKRHAQEWRRDVDRFWSEAAQRNLPMPSQQNIIVLGINEPHVWSMLAETVVYNVEFLRECKRLGLRAGALNLSVGWPSNHGPDTPADWKPYSPIEDAIRDGNHILFLHEYHDERGVAYNWRWWCGRFKWCPWQVPIIIGECGLDKGVTSADFDPNRRGWRGWYDAKQYVDELYKYAEACEQDGRIHSIQPFTTDGAREWQSFDTEPAHNEILGRKWPRVKPYERPRFPQQPTIHIPSITVAQPPQAMWVTAPDGLNVRGGPSVQFEAVDSLPFGTEVSVIGRNEDWANIGGNRWVAGWWLSDTKPVAEKPVQPTQPTQPTQAGIIDPTVAAAIIHIESGGQFFGPGGRLLIRFENHLFNRETGDTYRSLFDQGSPAWTGHRWRRNHDEAWRPQHNNQQEEWDAFEFASTLNRNAALRSISMGAPQILGSHYRRIGYLSPEHMFRAFAERQTGAASQMVGFTNFALSSPRLMQAIRDKDFLTVATIYNGSGQARHYATLMQSVYDRLKQ